MSGRDGRDGLDGRDGRDGVDADPAVVADEVLRRLVPVLQEPLAQSVGPDAEEVKAIAAGVFAEAIAALPAPKDGVDGKSVDWSVVRDAIEHFVAIAAKNAMPVDGARGLPGQRGLVGKDGEQGPRGPIGPMPRHEWKDDQVRFEEEPGVWGEYSPHLRGPRGYSGGGGIATDEVAVTSFNSYWPSGW